MINTLREPLRDVVARSLGLSHNGGAAYTHEDMLLLLAGQIDMLYTATDKLLQAVQLLIQAAAEQGQGGAVDGTNTDQPRGTAP